LQAEFGTSPIVVTAFSQAAKLLGTRGIDESVKWPTEFGFTMMPQQNVCLAGQPVSAVELRGSASLISREIKCPIVQAYGAPSETVLQRDAVIERFDLGETAIIHEGPKISILVDLAAIDWPSLSQIRL